MWQKCPIVIPFKSFFKEIITYRRFVPTVLSKKRMGETAHKTVIVLKSPAASQLATTSRGLFALDFSDRKVENVKATITWLVERKSATKAVYQLAAHLALMMENTQE
jgi:hypothetical protein